MTHDVLVNVIANLVASLILVALAGALIVAGSAMNFKRLFRFFGIASRRPSVKIQLSRLEIKPEGSRGADPDIQIGYVGPAINHVEYIGALLIRDLLRSKFLTILPQGWLPRWDGNCAFASSIQKSD